MKRLKELLSLVKIEFKLTNSPVKPVDYYFDFKNYFYIKISIWIYKKEIQICFK